MKLFSVPRTGLHVELRTRDEHCPPHVHVENEEVPWEARLAFSFVSDVIRLMDVDPIGDAPGTRAIDRIKAAIVNNLPKCRAEWWMKVGTCCLDNRWVRVSRDKVDEGKEGVGCQLNNAKVRRSENIETSASGRHPFSPEIERPMMPCGRRRAVPQEVA